ncbi:MAG: glycosyltransferase, partial [Actinomycetota bacterium]|nr:glycosyltransferase [Actinomycetota bacterium]
MGRGTAATVCVVAGDDRKATKAFLARVADGLGEHDNVLVLGAARPLPEDPAAWRVVTRGGSLARPAGATAPRLRPTVVLVEDRVELHPGWLDLLVGTLEDGSIGAVAPRSNVADGDELVVGVPYRPHEIALRRRFARDLQLAAAPPTDVEVLAGPCIAMRRDRLEEAGGLAALARGGYDPARLSRTIGSLGLRLAVAEACYVHHRGGTPLRPDPRDAGLPLVTACMIVKDEQEELPRCLASLAGIADEVVVYDTGSTDDTVRIASDAGARVLTGYWDDDFGRARNDALEACRGQWILWVDADESVVCPDPVRLREELAATTAEREAFVVHIENLNGNEAASTFVHPACRLFRRAYGRWDGRLHELVVARAGERELARELTSLVRIVHRGYLQSHIAGRDKAERNIRTAFADLAGDSGLDWGVRLASLGRSYVLNGRFEEALAHCRRAAEVATQASTARLARRTAANCLVALGRPEEALEEVERLRAISADGLLVDTLSGAAHLALGDYGRALQFFGRVHDAVDEDGFEYSRSSVAVPVAEALVGLGRHGDAADALLGSIRQSGGVDAHVGLLLECLERSGRDPVEAYDAIGAGRVEHFVPQLLQLQPDVADRTLDAWQARSPRSAPVLAAASHVARRLDVSRQLVWSARLRSAGLGHACPLVATASDASVAARDRVLAAAAASTMFADARARLAFAAAVLVLDPAERPAVEAEVAAIAPALLPRFALLLPREAVSVAGVVPTRAPRSVLVVDREPGNPRTTGLAVALARCGHDVTLLAPEPTQSATATLARLGVELRGWSTAGITSAEDDDQAAVSSIARCAAERPFDAVVVSVRAVASVGALRAILPRASVALDLSSSGLDVVPGDPVDLLLGSHGREAVGATYVVVPPESATVLPSARDLGIDGREGIVLLGSARRRQEEELSWYAASAAPVLAELATRHPVVVCGDDPDARLSASVPGAIAAGAVADPTPWLRAARVALLPFDEDADSWESLATASGIPLLRLGAAPGDSTAVLAAARAL